MYMADDFYFGGVTGLRVYIYIGTRRTVCAKGCGLGDYEENRRAGIVLYLAEIPARV